jgi:hypothetical protein
MHKARHTAGRARSTQLEQLLGHAPIRTTGDICTNWDIDKFAATMAEVLDDDGPTDREPNARDRSRELQKIPANDRFIPPTGFEPVLPP